MWHISNSNANQTKHFHFRGTQSHCKEDTRSILFSIIGYFCTFSNMKKKMTTVNVIWGLSRSWGHMNSVRQKSLQQMYSAKIFSKGSQPILQLLRDGNLSCAATGHQSTSKYSLPVWKQFLLWVWGAWPVWTWIHCHKQRCKILLLLLNISIFLSVVSLVTLN